MEIVKTSGGKIEGGGACACGCTPEQTEYVAYYQHDHFPGLCGCACDPPTTSPFESLGGSASSYLN